MTRRFSFYSRFQIFRGEVDTVTTEVGVGGDYLLFGFDGFVVNVEELLVFGWAYLLLILGIQNHL